MYKLLCQIFISITGRNLPEETFDVLWPLLQGSRKGRDDILLGVRDYSLQTPHQILLCDIPLQYHQTWEQFIKLKKKMNKKMFKDLYYKDDNGELCKPSHHSRKIWNEKVYGETMVRLNYILYMKTEREKNIVMKNLNQSNKLRGVDISWMSSCAFCGEFMRLRSYEIKNKKEDIEENCKKLNRYGINFSEQYGNTIRNTDIIPVCNLCMFSKERQEKYRMNMLSRGDWGQTLYLERDWRYHRNIGDMYDRPDMSLVPKDIKSTWDTPLNCCGHSNYCDITDPTNDNFWHPDLTADEYMRWLEHTKWSGIGNDPDPLDDDLYDQFDDE